MQFGPGQADGTVGDGETGAVGADGASATPPASETFVRAQDQTRRADPPPVGPRGRPGLDAHRAHSGHRARAAQDRFDDRDIHLIEVNEAFASVVLAWLDETGADPERVDVNGGAIALGRPIGASGTKLLATRSS